MKNRILLNRSHESCQYLSFLNSGLEQSEILAYNIHYLRTLGIWLKPVVQSQSSYWKRCWRASDDGWDSTTFHSKCDNKGPTVTIIRVGKYIFGGYTSTSWGKWIIKCFHFIFFTQWNMRPLFNIWNHTRLILFKNSCKRLKVCPLK